MIERNTLMTIINALVFSNCFIVHPFGRMQQPQIYLSFRLLKDLRWLPVKSQLYYRDAVFAFKCMSGQRPPYLDSLFLKRREVSGCVTRNSHIPNIPCFKSATEQGTCLKWTTNSRRGIKKPLSPATTRKRENLVTTAQKMASKRSARVDCHIQRRRNKYL